MRVAALLVLGACPALAQNAAMAQAAADSLEAQRQGLPLTEEQRKETGRLEQEAQRAAQVGRFGDALRSYAHAAAVLRNAPWTPALEFAASLQARTDHIMLDPGSPVTLSLAAVFPVAPSADTKLMASVLLGERQLAPPAPIDPARMPFALRFNTPELPAGNYALEARLTPAANAVPGILHDLFLKSVPVHIERLSDRAAALRQRLAHAPPGAALPTAEYVLRFYERVDHGQEGLRRFGRYPFGEQFAAANALLDDLDHGRDPFAAKHGDFRRAYRSPADQSLQPYRLFVPDAYDGSESFPLVVALHGAGGDENDFFDSYTEAPLLPQAQRLGFLVVCPKGRGPNSGYRGTAERDVFDVLAEVRREYRIDPRRIYLMGHSMGAYAAWRLAAQHRGIFAALGLIAGGGDPTIMPSLRDVPQYVVHGALDLTVPVAESRAMVAAARKAGTPVLYVELPSAGHYDAALGQFGPMLDFFVKQERHH